MAVRAPAEPRTATGDPTAVRPVLRARAGARPPVPEAQRAGARGLGQVAPVVRRPAWEEVRALRAAAGRKALERPRPRPRTKGAAAARLPLVRMRLLSLPRCSGF